MARGLGTGSRAPQGPRKRRQQSAHAKRCEHHAAVKGWMAHIPNAPEFHPTEEEWTCPMSYIKRIRPEAELYGICKIIPPAPAAVPSSKVIRGPDDAPLQFNVRHQPLVMRKAENLEPQRFDTSAELYGIESFAKLALETECKLIGAPGGLPESMQEAEYWRRRKHRATDVTHVQYGNDVEGTGFASPDSQDPLGSGPWNMRVLPRVPGSTLQLLEGEIPGVSTPMLYVGMIYATFAWHVEDHYLYSINYQHQGAAKTWYGVSGRDADGFEKACEQHVYPEVIEKAIAAGELREEDVSSKVHKLLLGKTTMFSPEVLVNAGVPVCRAVQRPGEFVVTFPRAYHAGFSHGFSIGEAVNFATGDWFLFGADSASRYRRLETQPILPHEFLVCEAATQLSVWLEKAESKESEDSTRALVGVYVDMVRQQHAQRAHLVAQGACQFWRESEAQTDCAQCRKLSYITVAIDNQISAGAQETLCLDCAVARGNVGNRTTILCSTKIKELEERARDWEQHPMLKGRTEDWLRMRAGRGLDECKNHGCGCGVMELPLPTEPFEWVEIADPIPVQPEEKKPFARPEEFQFLELPIPRVSPPEASLAPEAAQTGRTDKGPFLPPRKRARTSSSTETVHFASSSATAQQQWQPQPPCAFAHPDLPHAAHFEPHTPSLGTQQQQHETQQAAMQASMPANLAQQELSLPPSMADPAAFGGLGGQPVGMGMGMGAAGWNLQGMMSMMGRPAEQNGLQLHAEQDSQQGHAGAKRKLYEDTQPQKPAAKDGDKAHRVIFRVPGRRPPPAARTGAAAGAPAVLEQVGEAPGEGGQMFSRSIYHLHSDPSAPMLDLREFAKATGWSKRFKIKASSRDMASQSWKKVIGAVEAAGYAPSALCTAPQAHRVGAGGGSCYLLGLPHLKALFFAANLLEREMIYAFCGDVWPNQELHSLDVNTVKQEEAVPGSSPCTAPLCGGSPIVLPSPMSSPSEAPVDMHFQAPGMQTLADMGHEVEGTISRSFFQLLAQPAHPLSLPQHQVDSAAIYGMGTQAQGMPQQFGDAAATHNLSMQAQHFSNAAMHDMSMQAQRVAQQQALSMAHKFGEPLGLAMMA